MNLKRCRHLIAVVLALWAQVAVCQPTIVTLIALPAGPEPYEYQLVKLDPRDQSELHNLPAQPSYTALSRDARRLYALTEQDSAPNPLLQTYDATTLTLLQSVEVPPVQRSYQIAVSFVEHPLRPGVVVLDRCWWLDATSGALLESPATLLPLSQCRGSSRGDGFSSSGRYLLIDDLMNSRTLLVDALAPRTVIRELPYGAGPVMSDDQTIALGPDRVISITDGSITQRFELSEPWRSSRVVGTDGDHLYVIYFDAAHSTNALGRIALADGSTQPLIDRVVSRDGWLQVNGEWVLFAVSSDLICDIGGDCRHMPSQYALIDRRQLTIYQGSWESGGIVSTGAILSNVGPAATVSVPALSRWALAVLVGSMLLITLALLARSAR
ncbi:MAG: hypothetical protein IT478_16705 [Xanthomonadales bacterium]|nr:hypothetical protein [Xanthomonadales bacterium]